VLIGHVRHCPPLPVSLSHPRTSCHTCLEVWGESEAPVASDEVIGGLAPDLSGSYLAVLGVHAAAFVMGALSFGLLPRMAPERRARRTSQAPADPSGAHWIGIPAGEPELIAVAPD
jgi:hypothetical protein